jgi:KDO2-lipid IV(A) lauroyltransferase
MLPKRDVAKQVALLLEQGENLALLGDQYGGRNGCWIDFFGRPASYHKAIALFSMTGRAPIILSYTRRLHGQPLQLELGVEGVYDPLDKSQNLGGVREITQWYNDLLERIIARDPEQFWWLHDRWKGQPPAGKRRRKKAVAA